MDLFMKALTTISLTQSTGLNPILPILLMSLLGRYEQFFTSHGLPAPVSLPADLKFITSGWSIAFFIIIAILESIMDKAQWFDNVKHVTIDPIVSSLSSASTTFAVMSGPMSDAMYGNGNVMNGLPPSLCLTSAGLFEQGAGFWAVMVFLILLGLFVTVSFLFIKTALRWVISALPDMGVSNFLVSLLEDVIAVISVFLAFFAPILAVLFTILLAAGAISTVLYLRKKADEREKAEVRNLCFVQAII
ncbi:MAG TPA: DUF4126 domain-containing protein [Candidatus Eremiobacteraeota bacterium]|nr:DUF4126 domain-containing protein [Candidatus Eremiobacteraeota bacterium]